ncbi:hypothetical protein QBZ16_003585 [Prototheca wickerhamii]|uniref:Uncharacterized protein n=1 Tax=Prototheca wickerhamii TaxID=3111 RepID=A0AAD9IK99_PROWI|nr:hypothetical protein QBZ16_003585 [Prototheca wickerhamii]
MSDFNSPYANLGARDGSMGPNFVDYGFMGYPPDAQRSLLLSGVRQAPPGPAVNPLYKTELCRGWEETWELPLRLQVPAPDDAVARAAQAAQRAGPRHGAPPRQHQQDLAEAAEREAALGTLLSSLSIGDSACELAASVSPSASGELAPSPLAPVRSAPRAATGAAHGPESPLGALAGLSGLALSAEDANNPLLQSLRGLASAPGTPTGATVATRAVHRAATEAEGAATRRLPVFARIAEEGAR